MTRIARKKYIMCSNVLDTSLDTKKRHAILPKQFLKRRYTRALFAVLSALAISSPRFTVRVESGFGHCGTNRHTLHFANKITNERQLPSKMSVVAIMSQELQVHGQLQEKKTHVYRRFWFSKLKIACVFLLMVLVWSDFLGGMHAVCERQEKRWNAFPVFCGRR